MRSKRLNFNMKHLEGEETNRYIRVRREPVYIDDLLLKENTEDDSNWRVRFARRAVDVVTCKRRGCSCPRMGFRATLYYGVIPMLIIAQILFSTIRGGYDGANSVVAQFCGILACVLYTLLYMTDSKYDCKIIDPNKADTTNVLKNAVVWSLPSIGGIVVRAVILHGISETYGTVCPTFTFNNIKCL